MADASQLTAEPRTGVGRGPARATRRAGRIPGVIYGGGGDSQAISLNSREFGTVLNRPGFFATLFELNIAGDKHRVLCREVQFHPVKDNPIHADFLRVSEATRINVDVPVNFINEEECPGLKEGGVLNVVRHTIEINCRADSIPPEIMIDLTDREMGTSIHISEIELPDDVRTTIDRDFTIATVAAPTIQAVEEEEKPEGEEGLEGEEGEAAAAEGEAAADGEKPAEGASTDGKKSGKS